MITIYFDGGSKPPKSTGYGSYQILPNSAIFIINHGDSITCNEAEYLTLICALNHAQLHGGEHFPLFIFSDSKLVVEQVRGRWKLKNPRMKLLCQQVRQLLQRWKHWQIKWNPRQVNVDKFGH